MKAIDTIKIWGGALTAMRRVTPVGGPRGRSRD
jgi:hypothetical protein